MQTICVVVVIMAFSCGLSGCGSPSAATTTQAPGAKQAATTQAATDATTAAAHATTKAAEHKSEQTDKADVQSKVVVPAMLTKAIDYSTVTESNSWSVLVVAGVGGVVGAATVLIAFKVARPASRREVLLSDEA